MPVSYPGNSTGIVDHASVTVTNPVDADGLSAASNNSATQTLANEVQHLKEKALLRTGDEITGTLTFDGGSISINETAAVEVNSPGGLGVASGGSINVAHGGTVAVEGNIELNSLGQLLVNEDALVTVGVDGGIRIDEGGSFYVAPLGVWSSDVGLSFGADNNRITFTGADAGVTVSGANPGLRLEGANPNIIMGAGGRIYFAPGALAIGHFAGHISAQTLVQARWSGNISSGVITTRGSVGIGTPSFNGAELHLPFASGLTFTNADGYTTIINFWNSAAFGCIGQIASQTASYVRIAGFELGAGTLNLSTTTKSIRVEVLVVGPHS